jgi:iron(III) transport system permease protein
MMWGTWSARTAVLAAAIAAFGLFCLAPVVYMLGSVLTGDIGRTGGAVFLDARQRGLLYNTVVLGAGTAVLATAVGAPLGLMLARIPLRRKALLRLGLAAPILLPPYVLALCWTYLGSSRGVLAALTGSTLLSNWTHSVPAAVLIMSLAFYPLSMLSTEAAMRRLDPRLEEAGLLVAPPGRVLWHITFRLCGPGIVAAALIIFVLAISEFGVPGLLRVRVYTTEVFTAFASLYDFSRAMVVAVPLLVLSMIVAAVAATTVVTRMVPNRGASGAAGLSLPQWRRPAVVGALVTLAGALGVPLVTLVRQALASRSTAEVVTSSAAAVLNSLLMAAAGATAVVLIAVWLGYARARTTRNIGRLADITFIVLFAVPSTIVGVGLIGVWNRPGALDLYGTDAMLLLAYLARLLPVAAVLLAAAVRYVPVSHEEAAAVSGAGWTSTMLRIVLPQIRVGLGAVWVIVFVLAFGELGASILVAPPGETTLPIRIYTFIANAPPSQVAALALFQVAVILTPVAALALVSSRRTRV